jgi:hypothetical protein
MPNHSREVPRRAGLHGDKPTACPPASAMPTSPSGWRPIPGYEVLAELGESGLGVVCRARQIKADRVVALKIFHHGQSASETAVTRFREDMDAVALFDHPNIVPLYEIGEYEGQYYFTMKLYEGGSLAAQRILPPVSAARLMVRVARAVHHAHAHGILHRGLKPANILLDKEGLPHVSDFGLARHFPHESSLTQAGDVAGTSSYLAPEQAAGRKDLTTAVDVWGLGAVLFECLTGQPPFRGATAGATLVQITSEEPAQPSMLNPDVPRDLEAVCLKCLEKDPKRRYAGAEELARDLERWLAGEPVEACPVGFLERSAKWARRRPGAAFLLVIGFASLLSLLLFAAVQWHNAEKRARAPWEYEVVRGELKAAQKEVKETLTEVLRQQEAAILAHEKARHIRYASDMYVARAAWEAKDIPRMTELLEHYRPAAEGEAIRSDIPPLDTDDPRDFEWRYLWRLSRGATPAFRAVEGFRDALLATAFSDDGKTLTAVDRTGLLKVVDATTGRERIRVDLQDSVRSDPPRQWTASCAAFSAEGTTVALGTSAHGLVLCEVATGKEQRRVKMPEGIVRALAFSAKGKSLAVGIGAGPQSGAIKLFSDVGAAEPQSLSGNQKDVVSLAFSPDGGNLASASLDGTVRMWDMITLKERRIVEEEGDSLRAVAFSHDSKWLAVVSGDRVTIRETESGRVLRKLRGGQHLVAALAFSPTGRRVATAGADGVRLWDLAGGQEVLSLGGANDAISCLAFSADGQRLAAGRTLGSPSAVKGGEVRIWDAPVPVVNR